MCNHILSGWFLELFLCFMTFIMNIKVSSRPGYGGHHSLLPHPSPIPLCLLFIYMFCRIGNWTQVLYTELYPNPVVFFILRWSVTICPGWVRTFGHPALVSWDTGITSMYHHPGSPNSYMICLILFLYRRENIFSDQTLGHWIYFSNLPHNTKMYIGIFL